VKILRRITDDAKGKTVKMLATKLEVVSSNGSKNKTYNEVKRFAVEGLSDLIRVLMENVDDALFELSDKVDNDRERNQYFAAMREVRLKGDAIKREFDQEIQDCFGRVSRGKSVAKTSEVDEDDTELTLLEYDDLEDNIAISNMISRARPQFEDELLAVTERLKLVLKRDSLEADENPLDPQAICDCFHNASELLETDIQVKLIFYKLFERYVINNLGHFYREVNQFLIDKGVLPGFKADQARLRQTTRFMTNRINKGSPSTTISTTIDGLPAVGMADTAGGNLFAALQQVISGTAVDGTSPPAGNYATDSEGHCSSGKFVKALSNLQSVNLANQPPSEAITAIDPQNVKAATQQQLQAFRQENQHQFNSTDAQTFDVVSMLFDYFFEDDALPAPIKVLIGRLQIPILKVAILDKDFFNQKKHPARKLLDGISRASLGWSENPGEEQALIDKTVEIVNFVINEFDDDISVFDEAYINFENFIQQQQKQSDKALEDLEQQEQEKDRKIEAARTAAEQLIAKLTRNRDLSFEVIDFLETTWTSILFNTHLSLGGSSNHWRNLKRISTTFVWTLVPKFSEEERLKIIKTIPALLRAMSKGMELVNIKPEVQNRIFKMLAGEHARIVKLTSRNIVTRVDDITIWPEDAGADAFARAQGIDPAEACDFELTTDQAGEVQILENEVDDDSITIISAAPTNDVIDDLNLFTAGVKQGQIKVTEEIIMESSEDEGDELFDTDENHLQKAQELEIGSWVEFIGTSSKNLMARLSWKSKVTGNLMFVNRQGHKVRNCTINGFAIELHAGRAKCVESLSVYDRAIYTIMMKMQH
jgi:tetratricopeptide (TPR) repeat protein